MKSNRDQELSFIESIVACIFMGTGLVLYYGMPILWKGICWMFKQLYTKSPMVFRGIKGATTWTATKLKKTRPASAELHTPEIFRGQQVARARAFNMSELNRLK